MFLNGQVIQHIQLSMLLTYCAEDKTEDRKSQNQATTDGGCRKGLAKHLKESKSAFVDVHKLQAVAGD